MLVHVGPAVPFFFLEVARLDLEIRIRNDIDDYYEKAKRLKTCGGEFSLKTGTIYVVSATDDLDDILATINHEVIHAVLWEMFGYYQTIDGWYGCVTIAYDDIIRIIRQRINEKYKIETRKQLIQIYRKKYYGLY